MLKDIYDPLQEYVNVFHDRFRQVAGETFAQMARDAHVDVEANRQTCRHIYDEQHLLSRVKSRLSRWRFVCFLFWLCVAAAVYVLFFDEDHSFQPYAPYIYAMAILSLLLLLFSIHPHIKTLKQESSVIDKKVNELKEEAWRQMSPINRLYDWDMLTRMMTQTVPRLEFDPYFTTQRLADLEQTYDWDSSFNDDRSVVYAHSGLINGNPFIICRTRKMEWGEKVYEGSKTIYWTTIERNADGDEEEVEHSQVLTATVTAPYPEYPELTRVIYGNTAAPDLIFYREQSGLAGHEDSLSYKLKRRAVRKKARDLTNADFAMMTNEEFEVAFDTRNRNSNQQYALLFTPLAQESMLNLLKDNQTGYGDDFSFSKHKMINIIIPDHLQGLYLDMNPEQYHSFDYDQAERDFYSINAQYFRAIYFSLAPLLCVPMYQQIRPRSDIYGIRMKPHSSYWEHEALANFWGQHHFEHPDCATNSILKTEQHKVDANSSLITVYAYGYSAEDRLDFVDVWGGDGQLHGVPVHWKEYLPVTGSGQMSIAEDNGFKDDSLSPSQRIDHINEVLQHTDTKVYRRHIGSKVV